MSSKMPFTFPAPLFLCMSLTGCSSGRFAEFISGGCTPTLIRLTSRFSYCSALKCCVREIQTARSLVCICVCVIVCPVLYALCLEWFCVCVCVAVWPVLYGPCRMSCAVCPMPYALCCMACAVCPVLYALCGE